MSYCNSFNFKRYCFIFGLQTIRMKNRFGIGNKVAVITGGSGSLAGSVAKSFARAGVKLALLSRKKSSLNELLSEIGSIGGYAKAYEADILDESSLNITKSKIIADFGRIDILLNIAGGNLPGATVPLDKTLFDLSIDGFKKVTDLNLNGTVIPSLVFGKTMAEQKEGVILNYSSMAVGRAITRVAGDAVSKSALENFTRWMAVEMALIFGEGVRVNAIAPGFFIGKQNKALLTNDNGTVSERG